MESEEEQERRKREDKERKKAEVRRRLEEAAKAKKGKKGFMTADRKKKLRNLLRAKAAEELKKEQERRALERKRIIVERSGVPRSLDDLSDASLQRLCREYHERIGKLEDVKLDLEFEVRKKDLILNEMNNQVNCLRGKFVKPRLKKVSTYEAKLEKMQAIALKTSMDLRASLKKVKSGVFTFEETEGEEPTVKDESEQ